MNFVVEWTLPALSDLAHAWNTAPDPAADTAAANAAERLLAGHAATCGEPRIATQRCVAVAPLWVFYEVNQVTRKATIGRLLLLPS